MMKRARKPDLSKRAGFKELKEALHLAVGYLGRAEPGDSRVVSDEFVALACVLNGDASPEVMVIIRDATRRLADLPARQPDGAAA